MSQTELIQIVRGGGVIPRQPQSLFDAPTKSDCDHNCWQRTIVCDGNDDVTECSKCGHQSVTTCNFDEEYD